MRRASGADTPSMPTYCAPVAASGEVKLQPAAPALNVRTSRPRT
ncbi:hypothetical protein WJ972_21800 [Achromobacter insuavis]